MILRRIKAHVENENWFAVGIDFIIVVVGVFLGIQIGNWNEARVSQVQEANYLEQLRDEIADNADMARMQAVFVDNIVKGGRRGLEFLESGETCTTDCEALIIAFFHSSQVWGTNFPDAKYEETNRRGIPSDESLRLMVQNFYNYISGWDTVNATPPPFRERVRGHISADAMSLLWSDCYEIIGGANEILTSDCAEALSKLDLTESLNRIREDPVLANQLRYWVSQNEYGRQYYPTVIARSDATVSAINQHLGRTR